MMPAAPPRSPSPSVDDTEEDDDAEQSGIGTFPRVGSPTCCPRSSFPTTMSSSSSTNSSSSMSPPPPSRTVAAHRRHPPSPPLPSPPPPPASSHRFLNDHHHHSARGQHQHHHHEHPDEQRVTTGAAATATPRLIRRNHHSTRKKSRTIITAMIDSPFIFYYYFLLIVLVSTSILDRPHGWAARAAPLINSNTESTLDVLRDQPGMSPLEVQERDRRCGNITQLSCTPEELETLTVCGSDGRTYSSLCEIKKMACHGNHVQVIDKGGPCPAKKKCLLERAFQKELTKRRNQSDVVIPECEADGSYSPVQCHKETGFCWCVTNTGRPIPTTSVQFKRPDCMPQGKVGRRSSRRRLGNRRRGCSTADRSTFSTNLLKIFRAEFEKETTRPRQNGGGGSSTNGPEDTTGGVIALRTSQVIDWKFNQLDTNRDRAISPRESVEFRRMIRDRVQPKACARRFAKYCDLNSDKRIEKKEWSTCLGIDISMSFRLFQSLNTSEMQRQAELQHQQQQERPNPDEEEEEEPEDYDGNMDEMTTITPPRRPKSDGGGRRRGGGQEQQQQPVSPNSPFALRRHAGGGGGSSSRLHSEDLISASRNMASSAPSGGGGGFGFLLSGSSQKPEKEEPEEPTDCQSQRRRAQEQLRLNPGSGVYIPYCQSTPDANGGAIGRLFERVQCHDSGFCWCADPESGKPIPGTSKKSERPDCTVAVVQVGKAGGQGGGGDGEIKGCPIRKRADFIRRLHGTLVSSMIASGQPDTEDMSRVERALRWKFDELDKNKNKILERKEWKPYRLELKTWKGMRKCGRNFLRSCDANGDKRITLAEWLNCAGNSLRAATSTSKPNSRRGPNPFVNILDPHQ